MVLCHGSPPAVIESRLVGGLNAEGSGILARSGPNSRDLEGKGHQSRHRRPLSRPRRELRRNVDPKTIGFDAAIEFAPDWHVLLAARFHRQRWNFPAKILHG